MRQNLIVVQKHFSFLVWVLGWHQFSSLEYNDRYIAKLYHFDTWSLLNAPPPPHTHTHAPFFLSTTQDMYIDCFLSKVMPRFLYSGTNHLSYSIQYPRGGFPRRVDDNVIFTQLLPNTTPTSAYDFTVKASNAQFTC